MPGLSDLVDSHPLLRLFLGTADWVHVKDMSSIFQRIKAYIAKTKSTNI